MALLALVVLTARAAVSSPPRDRCPAAALALAWILAYSVVGGLNGLLGLAGFVWLRATNRYSIWILALVLLWGVLAISRTRPGRRRRGERRSRRRSRGGLDARRPAPAADAGGRGRASASGDGAPTQPSPRSLEAALPAGAMLFQLPVVDFPEGQRIRAASDYEHLRPYLHSTRLRFSYGSDKGRARDAWQRRVEALEPAAMADALERMGFSGLVVNRKAYPDGAQELRDAARGLGPRSRPGRAPTATSCSSGCSPPRARSLPTKWS